MIPTITELGSKVNSVKTQTYGKLSIVADITRAIS